MASPRALTVTAILLGAGAGSAIALLEPPHAKPPSRPPAKASEVVQRARPAAAVPAPPPVAREARPTQTVAHLDAVNPSPAPPKTVKREVAPYDLEGPNDAEGVAAAERACGGADIARECIRAAIAYATGQVVPQNQRKVAVLNHRARMLFEKACERRDAEGCYALAWLHANGRGVQRSGEVAMNMFVRTLELCRTRRQGICQELGEAPP